MHNYKLLHPLLSLLQTRNLTESARQLNVTQSAMSRTLTQIRAAFDDPILIREGKGFVLTAHAETLLVQLPSMIRMLDSLYVKKAFTPSECSRQFNVAYTSFLSSSISPIICANLEKVAPNTRIHSHLWQGGSLSSQEMKNVDLVATLAHQIPENIYGKKLTEDSYVVVMSASNPLAKAPLTIESYANAKHVLVSSISNIKKQVDDVISITGIKRKILALEPSFFSAIKVINSTNAIITMPKHLVAEYCDMFDLIVKPLPFELATHDYYLLWHAKFQHDPEHRWFREFCFPLILKYLENTNQAAKHLDSNN